MFSRADWITPPPQGVRLKGRFLGSGQGQCVLVGAHQSLRSVDGHPFDLFQANTNSPGLYSPHGLRIYGDYAGQDDDGIRHPISVSTSRAVPYTSILYGWYVDVPGRYQHFHQTGNSGDLHHALLNADETLTLGYDGGNGFKYLYKTDYAVTDFTGPIAWVISTEPAQDLMNLSIDGQYPQSGSVSGGQASYLGGGSYSTSAQPILGGGGSGFTNYYSLNMHVLLWASLSGVFLSQAEADIISSNPWCIFEPQRLIWPHIDMGGAGGVSVPLSGVGGTGNPGTLAIAGGAALSLSGAAGTGGSGTLGSAGGALQSLDGNSATGAAGVLSAIGAALHALAGVSATGQVGTVVVTTASGVSFELSAVTSTGAAGTLSAVGAAIQALTGVTGTGAIGDLSATASALQSLSGVGGTGQTGTITTAGGALLSLLGLAATGQVGSVTVTTEGGVSFSISGVAGAGSPGDLSAIGAALQALLGVSGIGQIGTLGAGVSELVALSGVSAAGSPGVLAAIGAALLELQGAAATGQAGSISIPVPADQAGELLATITITVAIDGGLSVEPALTGTPKLH